MIDQLTLDKLRSMRLGAMADAFESQSRGHEYDGLSFNEIFKTPYLRVFESRVSFVCSYAMGKIL